MYILQFPINLRSAETGELRVAKANEIELGIDDVGFPSEVALTEYPRDKNGAIWFEQGTDVTHRSAVYVAKLYPHWCPSFMPGCSPTVPIEQGKKYAGTISWLPDTSYRDTFAFTAGVGLPPPEAGDLIIIIGWGTPTFSLTIPHSGWVTPPTNGNGIGGWWDWIQKNPIPLVIGGVGIAGVILLWPKGDKR